MKRIGLLLGFALCSIILAAGKCPQTDSRGGTSSGTTPAAAFATTPMLAIGAAYGKPKMSGFGCSLGGDGKATCWTHPKKGYDRKTNDELAKINDIQALFGSGNDYSMCGLDSHQKVICWESEDYQLLESDADVAALGSDFTDVATGSYIACVLKEHTPKCFGIDTSEKVKANTAKKIKYKAAGHFNTKYDPSGVNANIEKIAIGFVAVAKRINGSLTFWNSKAPGYEKTYTSGYKFLDAAPAGKRIASISAGGKTERSHRVCVVYEEGGSVQCFRRQFKEKGDVKNYPELLGAAADAEYLGIAIDGPEDICLITKDAALACFREPDADTGKFKEMDNAALQALTFKTISVQEDTGCGITDQDKLVCWHPSEEDGKAYPEDVPAELRK